jgi:RAB protein geranylgeranyltransferase component A
MKFKVKEFVENHRAEVNRKHQKAISDSVSKKDELTSRMNVFIDEEKAKLLSLKIIVPNFLEQTFKYLSSL